MSEDAASSSSSTQLQGANASPGWSADLPTAPRSVVRTTEKSVTLRVRMEEKFSDGSDTRQLCTTKILPRLPPSQPLGPVEDADVNEIVLELYAELERKQQWLNKEEQTFQQGQERLGRLQQQHKALLDTLEQCKWRRREKTRIQKMLQGPQSDSSSVASFDSGDVSDSDSDSDLGHKRRRSSNGSHHRRAKDGAKKERKKLRRFQKEVSLQFQLLQSECRRTDLEVGNLVANMKREYADSCFFGDTANFLPMPDRSQPKL